MRNPSSRHLPIAAAGVPAPPEERPSGEGDRLLRVGDLERITKKTVRAIHLYEELGLLIPRDRSKKGKYRLYDNNALARIQWIDSLHALGLSLTQIKEMLDAWQSAPSAPAAMAKVRADYDKKLRETRDEIAKLQKLERELVASIAYLDTCDTCDTTELVHACSSCSQHDHAEPELVAGFHREPSARPSVALPRS